MEEYIDDLDFEKLGLVEVCDVCGKPLYEDNLEKIGIRYCNQARCHSKCLNNEGQAIRKILYPPK